jgi:hypothetical protein
MTIAGISGIEQYHDYLKGYFEQAPYNNHHELKSIYHYRQFDVEKLKLFGRLSPH